MYSKQATAENIQKRLRHVICFVMFCLLQAVTGTKRYNLVNEIGIYIYKIVKQQGFSLNIVMQWMVCC